MTRFSLLLMLWCSLLFTGCTLIGGDDDDNGAEATFTASTYSFRIEGDGPTDLGQTVTFNATAQRLVREGQASTLSLFFSSRGESGVSQGFKRTNASVNISVPLGLSGRLNPCDPCELGVTPDLDSFIRYTTNVVDDSLAVDEFHDFRGVVLMLEDFELTDNELRGTFTLEAEQISGLRRRQVRRQDGTIEDEREAVTLTTDGKIRVVGSFALKSTEMFVRYDNADV